MMKKPIMIATNPTWAMIKYKKPPRIDFSFCSMITKKYEVILISSKKTKNQMTLSTTTTNSIETTNMFMKKPTIPRP